MRGQTDYCMDCMEPLTADGTCPNCGDGAHRPQPSAPPPHFLPAGTVLAGRYLVGRSLGRGGFGITYLGRDLTLNMRVAIKEYYPSTLAVRDGADSPVLAAIDAKAQRSMNSGKGRFLDEARVLAKFHDEPGIVDVRDYFEENGTAYIVMDYLDGKTLKEHLKDTKLDADTAFALMQPVLDALERVHAEHVIHRDISPDNIMLRNDGTLCLMDFGAAHVMDYADERTVSMVLKSGYAPEEQYRAKGELGPWTDIYALCATMYRAITGIAPDESLQRLVGDEMKWPSEMGVEISEEQERILKRGMAPRHADRYQSIADMKADIARIGKTAGNPNVEANVAMGSPGNSAGSAESEGAEPDEKRLHRKRAIAVGCLAAVFAIAALLAYYLLAPAHSVSFASNGGSDVATVQVNRIEPIQAPQDPIREGYEFAGWYADESLREPVEFPLTVDSDETLYAAWTKVRCSYRVRYLDNVTEDEVADTKVIENAPVGEKVTETAPHVEGYVPASAETASLIVSDDEPANEMAFRYSKLASYEVRYVNRDTEADVLEPKTVTDLVEGSSVTETAPDVAGFTLSGDATQTITVNRDAQSNQIVFYYDPVVIAVPYVSNSGSQAQGNSNSGTTSSNSSGRKADDVVWAN